MINELSPPSPATAATWATTCWRRSTTWALLAMALSIVGIGVVTAVGVLTDDVSEVGYRSATAIDPTGGSLAGVGVAGYLAAVGGVLAVTGEPGVGGRTAAVAVAARPWHVVVGRALVVGAVTLVTAVASTGVAFFAATAALSTADIRISLSHPGVLRALVGAALYLALLAAVGTGYGWLLGNTVGALSVLTGVLVLLPVLGRLLPTSIGQVVGPYLPSNAGAAIMQLRPGEALGPWIGFAVFAGYVATVLLGASARLRRRDA